MERAARGKPAVGPAREGTGARVLPGDADARAYESLADLKVEIGDMEGYRLDEHPVLEAMNRHYAQMEEEALRGARARLPGYFELQQEQA